MFLCQNSEDKSQSSNESFYERQLSVAFDEGEAFRDSAVYCEMDPDQAVTQNPTFHVVVQVFQI
jgi:hypothetical protein